MIHQTVDLNCPMPGVDVPKAKSCGVGSTLSCRFKLPIGCRGAELSPWKSHVPLWYWQLFPSSCLVLRSDGYRLLSCGVGLKLLTFISSLCKHNLTSEFSVKERTRAHTHARTRTYAHTQNPLTDTSFKYYYFDFCTNVFFFSHFDSLKWPCFKTVLYDCMYVCSKLPQLWIFCSLCGWSVKQNRLRCWVCIETLDNVADFTRDGHSN